MKKKRNTRRVVFKKADYENFAKKLEKWSSSLSAEEQALLIAVLDKGSESIRTANGETIHTTTTLSIEAMEFDLGQFVVKLLLALKGIEAEVIEDGPSWIEEITWAKAP